MSRVCHVDSTNPESLFPGLSALSEQYVICVTVRSTAWWPESRFESRFVPFRDPVECRPVRGSGGGMDVECGRISEFVEFIEYELKWQLYHGSTKGSTWGHKESKVKVWSLPQFLVQRPMLMIKQCCSCCWIISCFCIFPPSAKFLFSYSVYNLDRPLRPSSNTGSLTSKWFQTGKWGRLTVEKEQCLLLVSNKTLNQSNSQSSNLSPAEPSPHHQARAMWRSREQIFLASSDSNNFEFLSISNADTPSEITN